MQKHLFQFISLRLSVDFFVGFSFIFQLQVYIDVTQCIQQLKIYDFYIVDVVECIFIVFSGFVDILLVLVFFYLVLGCLLLVGFLLCSILTQKIKVVFFLQSQRQ
eukprot:TRINITY_DN9969_c0_g1_i3.p4 TRINITY_DN9969_c0_g1~~TRINITY_DN9969_c0_g1_i3.p4  ORF type:complete len:105 (+),score=0.03 TRINITY_DN9969_c0_g1_i3:320-634(+)